MCKFKSVLKNKYIRIVAIFFAILITSLFFLKLRAGADYSLTVYTSSNTARINFGESSPGQTVSVLAAQKSADGKTSSYTILEKDDVSHDSDGYFANVKIHNTEAPYDVIATENLENQKAYDLCLAFDLTQDVGTSGISAYASNNNPTVNVSNVKAVVQKTAPKATAISISSSRTDGNSDCAVDGDTVKISIITDEMVKKPDVYILGNEVKADDVVCEDSTNLNKWTATYTLKKGAVADCISPKDSNIDVKLTNLAGLSADDVTATTDNSKVTYYPSTAVTNVSLVSSGANTSYAKENDTVTLKFTTDTGIDVKSVLIMGKDVIPSNDGNGNWNAKVVLTGQDPDPSYKVDFSAVLCYHSNPNFGFETISSTSDGSTVKYYPDELKISDVQVATDNSKGSSYAKNGDTLTVTFTANHDCKTPSVKIIGVEVSQVKVKNEDNKWQFEYKILSGSGYNKVSYSIGATDMVGNVSNIQNTGSAVNYYPPLKDINLDLTLKSDDSYGEQYAKNGSTLTLSALYEGSVPFDDITVDATIMGQPITLKQKTGETKGWDLTYKISDDSSTFPEGAIVCKFVIYDKAGNSIAIEKTSNVVYDRTAPTASAVCKSNNSNDSGYATNGNTVTVTLKTDENCTIDSAAIMGKKVTVTGADTNFTFSYTIPDDEKDYPEGKITYQIAYTDLAGNKTTSINDSGVTYYISEPKTESVIISSDNATSGYAKQGNTITLKFLTNQDVNTPNVQIMGSVASVSEVAQGNRKQWMASYKIPNDLQQSYSTVGFSISLENCAGIKKSDSVTQTSDNSKLMYYPPISDDDLNVSLVSDNSFGEKYAKNGSTLTLSSSFVGSVPFGDISVEATILGQPITLKQKTGGTKGWDSTYKINDDSGTFPEGAVMCKFIVNDKAGNSTTIEKTTNVVYDRTAPTAAALHCESTNNSSGYAKDGDTVTIDLTTNEGCTIDSATIMGKKATVSGNGTSFTISYIIPNDEKEYPEGQISYQIIFTDLAGNTVKTPVTASTDESGVTYYRSKPQTENVTALSSNAVSSYAKQDDIITLKFSTNQDVNTPNVQIMGNAAVVSEATQGNRKQWVATYKIPNDSQQSYGTIEFSISLENCAGIKKNDLVTQTSDNSKVTYYPPITKSDVSIVSDNVYNKQYARNGSILTLTVGYDGTTPTSEIQTEAKVMGNVVPMSAVSGKITEWLAVYKIKDDNLTMPEGSVSFVADFIDPAGNTLHIDQSNVTNDVIYDHTLPKALSASIKSTNGNQCYAKPGDTITIALTTNENCIVNSATIMGKKATVTGDGTKFTIAYIIPNGGTELPEGQITYQIGFVDLAGNTVDIPVTTSTDESKVTYYRSEPQTESVTILSDNAATSCAKQGNIIKLKFSTNQDVNTPSVQIMGSIASVSEVIQGNCNQWVASYNIPKDLQQSYCIIPFSISLENCAGIKKSNPVTQTSDNSKVTYYPPIIKSDVSIVSDNAYNNKYARNGSVITLKVMLNGTTPTSEIETDTKIMGNSVPMSAVSGKGIGWLATYKIKDDNLTMPEGSISFTVNLKDLAGNTLSIDEKSVTDDVIYDRTLPYASSASMISSNKNPHYAKNGDTITVSLQTSEIAHIVSAIIMGRDANVSGKDTSFTFSYTIPADESSLPEGAVSISIVFDDRAGNRVVVPVTAATDSTSITYDRTAPLALSVSIKSSNINTREAKNGDSVTVLVKTSEAVQKLSASICGRTAKVSGSGREWVITYSIPLDEKKVRQGVVNYSITFEDLSGNRLKVPLSKASDGSSVIYDSITPRTSYVSIHSTNSNKVYAKNGDTVILEFHTSEPIQVPKVMVMGRSAKIVGKDKKWTASYIISRSEKKLVDGTVPFQITMEDIAGNPAGVSTASDNSKVTYDHTLPKITSVGIVSSGVHNQYAKNGDTVTLHFVTDEKVQMPTAKISGVKAKVSGNGRNFAASVIIPAGSSSFADGKLSFSVLFKDIAGNIVFSPVTTVTDHSSVTCDNTKPVISIQNIATGFFNGKLQPRVKYGDKNLDTSSVTIKLNGAEKGAGAPVSAQEQYQKVITITKDGNYHLEVSASDLAGNKGVSQSVNFVLDNSTPHIYSEKINLNKPLAFKSGWTPAKFIGIEDATGFQVISCRLNGVDWDINKAITNEGKNALYVEVQSASGNVSSLTYQFYIDKSSPRLLIRDTYTGNTISGKDLVFYQKADLKLSLQKLEIATEKSDSVTQLMLEDQNGRTIENIRDSQKAASEKSGQYTLKLTRIAQYKLLVKAQDEVGNKTSMQYNITVKRKSIFQQIYENKPIFYSLSASVMLLLSLFAVLFITRTIRKLHKHELQN